MSSFKIRSGGSVFYTYIKGSLPEGYNHIGSVDISSYDSKTFQNKNTVIGKVMLADSANNDAFGRLRISSPQTLFEGNMISSSQPEFFDISQNNGAIGTYNSTESTMTFDVSRANQFVKRQSHYYTHYQPGKSLAIMMSFYFGNNIPVNAYKRVGWNDDNEGIYFQQDSNNLSWNIQSKSAMTTFTANQSSWNIDTLQATGPSGATLNINQTNIIFIDMEWLGVGRVRVGFVIGGKIIYCHEFIMNNLTVPYISSAYLPLRYQIGTSTDQSSTVSMKQICCTAMSEGGYQPIGNVRSYIMENTKRLVVNQYTPILSIRLKSQYGKAQLTPISYTIYYPSGNQIILSKIIYRGTITGSNFQSASQFTEVDLSATDISGGNSINSAYITSQIRTLFSAQPESVLNLQSDINGDCDILSICCKSTQITGTQPDIYVCIDWREIN